MPAQEPVIYTKNLTRTYGSRRGIDAVSLAIPRGSIYGFLGPNGAGKTTTIRVLLGFLRATEGEARVFGLDCWRDSPRIKEGVGYLPGDLRLHNWLTGRKAVGIFGRIRGKDMRPRANELAELFQLDMGVKVRAMSRGMRQKLGLILTLAHDPLVVILDEPSSALDPLMQDRLREELERMAARGSTIFFSSHTLAEVEQLCQRVAIVRAGRIVADATVAELRGQATPEIEITWPRGEGARPVPPRSLKLSERTPERWAGTIHGPVREVVAWLGTTAFADVTITRPDLETIFRRYYKDPAPTTPPAAGEATNPPSRTQPQENSR
ncbi:MAG: ABC transporter ATP-binding protein [Planctomycetota bacterium]|nr:ABC transporter ATP-binding protein [Planctomycetota bacterium]